MLCSVVYRGVSLWSNFTDCIAHIKIALCNTLPKYRLQVCLFHVFLAYFFPPKLFQWKHDIESQPEQWWGFPWSIAAHLIFVTDTTDGVCGEKLVKRRNFPPWHVVKWRGMEKNRAKNFVCGEKRTNIRYDSSNWPPGFPSTEREVSLQLQNMADASFMCTRLSLSMSECQQIPCHLTTMHQQWSVSILTKLWTSRVTFLCNSKS